MKKSYLGGMMPPKKVAMIDAVPYIIEKMTKFKKKHSAILLAGGSASGKTTLANELIVSGATKISMDDYLFGRQYSESHGYSLDQRESTDIDLLASHLKDLKNGKSIKKPVFSFLEDGGKRIGYEQVDPARVIVVEGLFALDPRLTRYGDLRIFIKTSCHGRFIRRIMRDSERTTWDQRKILDYFIKDVDRMHKKYVADQEDIADVVIDNPFDPIVETDQAICFSEKQVKTKLDSVPSIEAIQRMGANFLAHTIQEDHYFVGSGQLQGEIVRVRIEQGTLTFTYKAPVAAVVNNGLRVKNKFEFPISEKECEDIKSLFEEKMIIIKERDIFVLDGIVFSLDKIVQDGKDLYFLEIRARTTRDSKVLLGKLKIRGNLNRESYYEIFSK